jgi:hypothetical protein
VNSSHDLEHLVRQATATMSAEYERMRRLAKEDPGTSGDQGEVNWAELLSKWLPGTFHVVTKGRIISSTGQTSGQVDVLVLSPSYPMGLLSNKLYIAAGVLAAFECKRTLRREHIIRSVRNGVELSRMTRADKCVPHHIVYGLLAHSHELASIRNTPAIVLEQALKKADSQEVTDPRDCLDFVCVPSLGTWSLMRVVGEKGQLTIGTSYQGPVFEVKIMGKTYNLGLKDKHRNIDPIGRFLTGLLHRLGQIDESIAAIAEYFQEVGLYGIGISQGGMRQWPFEEIPEDLRSPLY